MFRIFFASIFSLSPTLIVRSFVEFFRLSEFLCSGRVKHVFMNENRTFPIFILSRSPVFNAWRWKTGSSRDRFWKGWTKIILSERRHTQESWLIVTHRNNFISRRYKRVTQINIDGLWKDYSDYQSYTIGLKGIKFYPLEVERKLRLKGREIGLKFIVRELVCEYLLSRLPVSFANSVQTLISYF